MTTNILLGAVVIVALTLWASHLSPLKNHPEVKRLRNFLPPFLILLVGLLAINIGMCRIETGRPGTYKGGGPVFGEQDVIVGVIIVMLSVGLAVHAWFSKE